MIALKLLQNRGIERLHPQADATDAVVGEHVDLVVTQSGRSLGRCYDLRGELTSSKLRITGLCVGRGAWLEHLGIQGHNAHKTVPWSAVVRLEGKKIVVRDDAID